MKSRRTMSRRTAGWLIAILAAFVVMHYAYGSTPTALTRTRPVTGTPAMSVTLQGEITHITSKNMTITLEDTHGSLTKMTRTIEFDNNTTFVSPGKPQTSGAAGLSYLQKGYRVIVKGQGTSQNGIVAQLVGINFPPLNGTVASINHSELTLHIAGQPHPAKILLTSHTAFYVPNGDWNLLKSGSPIRVWVIPHTGPTTLQATTIMVMSSKKSGA